jgi:hypothetical protein
MLHVVRSVDAEWLHCENLCIALKLQSRVAMLGQSSEVGLGDRSSLHATLCARRLPHVTK